MNTVNTLPRKDLGNIMETIDGLFPSTGSILRAVKVLHFDRHGKHHGNIIGETETQLLCQFAKLEKALHTDQKVAI
jgi:hypothetical protein